MTSSVAKSKPSHTATCVHHWLLADKPKGGYYAKVCKFCGETGRDPVVHLADSTLYHYATTTYTSYQGFLASLNLRHAYRSIGGRWQEAM